MLLLHSPKVIFIKTRKTASTSLEILLSTLSDNLDDIITPITPEDEAIRAEQGIKPKNYLYPNSSLKNPYSWAFWNHIDATKIKERLNPVYWNGYFKITSERHPYEKAVSMAWYKFMEGEKLDDNFEKHLNKTLHVGKYRNFDKYSINGKIVADFIIRYEHIKEDMATLSQKLNVPDMSNKLAFTKVRQRQNKTPASEVLTAEQKRMIQDKCREEFEYFKYKP